MIEASTGREDMNVEIGSTELGPEIKMENLSVERKSQQYDTGQFRLNTSKHM